jgi:hypothetical protein
MSGTLPWGSPTATSPVMNDPNESLRRIEQSTAQTLQWLKYLVYLIAILLVVNILLLV